VGQNRARECICSTTIFDGFGSSTEPSILWSSITTCDLFYSSKKSPMLFTMLKEEGFKVVFKYEKVSIFYRFINKRHVCSLLFPVILVCCSAYLTCPTQTPRVHRTTSTSHSTLINFLPLLRIRPRFLHKLGFTEDLLPLKFPFENTKGEKFLATRDVLNHLTKEETDELNVA